MFEKLCFLEIRKCKKKPFERPIKSIEKNAKIQTEKEI